MVAGRPRGTVPRRRSRVTPGGRGSYDCLVATRGDQTREQLLDVAEQLFGDLGVANVSLRQIRLAAGQGNTAAVQYHFGDRDGVVRAIAERHTPRLLARQAELLGEIDPSHPPALAVLVDAFVRPTADYVALGPSERAWVKILAELLADPQLSFDTITEHTADQAVQLGMSLYDALAVNMAADVAAERIWAVSQFTIQFCASRARVQDDPDAARALSPDAGFAQNLVDMAFGALTAPVTAPMSNG